MTAVKLLRPVPEQFGVSAEFGRLNLALWNPYHRGIDFACPMGTPVQTAKAGTATIARTDGLGLFVTIDHGQVEVVIDGATHRGRALSRYCHLDQTKVASGAHVDQGQVVGYSGSSGKRKDGKATPAHLHHELEIGGVFVNPAALWAVGPFSDVMPEDPGAGYIARVSKERVMVGDSRGFRPDDPVSRREMAILICRQNGWEVN